MLALNPALDINQYAHTAWTVRDGFFGGRVLSIAQTPDGYLWVGTESGLFRFDGVRAVRWQPPGAARLPHATIAKLLVTRDGRLWIGTFAGLVSWKNGRLVTYPELAGQVVPSLVEDAQGTVWAGTLAIPHGRLCAIRTAVQCSGQDGRLGNGVFSLLEDRGEIWVGAATGLWRWAPGNPIRYATPSHSSPSDLIKIKDGPLLLAMTGGLKQLAGGTLDDYRIADVGRNPTRLLVDRDGGFWIGTLRDGLIHVHSGRVDRFGTADGLAGDSVDALFEDREGNIWVGTTQGLERFRARAVTQFSRYQGLPQGVGVAVLPSRDGSVWISSGSGVARWAKGKATVYDRRSGLPDDGVGTLFEDSSGRILLSTLSGMATFAHGRIARIPSLSSTSVIYNIVEDRAGFWMNDQQQGLIHLSRQDVVTRIPWSALGRDDHATAMVTDRARNGLWLGFYNGGVAFVKDGAVQKRYGTTEGLGSGRVAELRFDADGTLWAATAGGLSRITDKGITTLTAQNGLPCESVHWMLLGTDGSHWLLMPCGLARISSAELTAWAANPNRRVTLTLFDGSDGVVTQTTPIGFTPAAAWLPDGRLWFATPQGVGVLDPRQLPVNTLAPPVHIEQLVADDRTYDTEMNADRSVHLPARTRYLQVDYTALSLVSPEKTKFRYKLEGVDANWREVGNRRQAFYTNLSPRQYTFRVTAANNDGVWNEVGTTLAFAIAPAYYQTNWFLALSAGMVVALVWGAHRLRLRIVERHRGEISALNERLMKAQEQERMRIAGELHDGVMQQMLAATMMLGTAKRRITDPAAATETIDKIQEKLVQAGTDIRQLSHALHPPILQEAGLPRALQAYCEQFSATCGVPISCEADESARDLSRGSALALFRITQEALGNAAKHAQATRIAVTLRRTVDTVTLAISDDGAGVDVSRFGTFSGGLGLVMMRERTNQLDGTFSFDSAPGRGTSVTVSIPFR